MPTSPYIAGFLYLLSGLLDAFDGYAARTLNQGILHQLHLSLVGFLIEEYFLTYRGFALSCASIFC